MLWSQDWERWPHTPGSEAPLTPEELQKGHFYWPPFSSQLIWLGGKFLDAIASGRPRIPSLHCSHLQRGGVCKRCLPDDRRQEGPRLRKPSYPVGMLAEVATPLSGQEVLKLKSPPEGLLI